MAYCLEVERQDLGIWRSNLSLLWVGEPVGGAPFSRDTARATGRISARSDFERGPEHAVGFDALRIASTFPRVSSTVSRGQHGRSGGRAVRQSLDLRKGCQKNLVHHFHAPGNVWWGRLQYGREIASEQ